MSLPLTAIGQVIQDLRTQGVVDLDELSRSVAAALDRTTAVHPLAFHLFLADGPGPRATVIDSEGRSHDCIVWTHNVYLGLNRHPAVIRAAIDAVETYGTGAGGPPPIGGFTAVHDQLAGRIAALLGKERAVLFPTGYTANVGALSGLAAPGDLVLLDRECHSSLFQGTQLSGARWMAFRHNDLDDLGGMVKRHAAKHPNVFVVVESAYSMSGELAPLEQIVSLQREHGFRLVVDESHTFGFYGRGGRGYSDELGLLDQIDFITSTFSKATAGIGGFVAGRSAHCLLLELSARNFLTQACSPPADAAVVLAALEELEANPDHAAALHANNRSMREGLTRAGFDLGTSRSPIIPIRIADTTILYEVAARLAAEGIFVQPITEPGVPRGESRLRFVVTAVHTQVDIERTVEVMSRLGHEFGLLARTPVGAGS